ncbi:hypothetical protein QFZ56_006173 [Streptomyces achromogenes]|uniref:Uncharacterized protein n=2 Tax=Streptomyces achromogenes TaxID=67255 RepID=A0ABU0QBK5_STRAH|nr:hypothetical protein [Streptomyces achromogenes]
MAGVRRFGAGGLLVAGAGVCGILALWAAQETVLRGAESVLPRASAPAVLTCAYASAAVGLGFAARNQMRAAAEAAVAALEEEDQKVRPASTAPGHEGHES